MDISLEVVNTALTSLRNVPAPVWGGTLRPSRRGERRLLSARRDVGDASVVYVVVALLLFELL